MERERGGGPNDRIESVRHPSRSGGWVYVVAQVVVVADSLMQSPSRRMAPKIIRGGVLNAAY
jgi:hypothetical protein